MGSHELDVPSAPPAVIVPSYVHPDSDGLQFVGPDAAQDYPEHEGLQVVPESQAAPVDSNAVAVPAWYNKDKPVIREDEGLQAVHGPKVGPIEPDVAAAPTWYKKNSKLPVDIPTVTSRRRRPSSCVVAGIIMAAILLIVGAVLGGVLGVKAAHLSDATLSGSGNGNSPSSRLRSATGTFNGTGLSILTTEDGGDTVFFAFQNASGPIVTATFQFNSNTSELTISDASDPQIYDAANGTGLSLVMYTNSDNGTTFQLFYVNKDGIYADQIVSHWPIGSWANGQLRHLKVKAPTDNRPVLFAYADAHDGMHTGSAGARLFAGGLDGSVYQYSYDQPTDTWASDSTYHFSEAWAYGGAALSEVHDASTNTKIYNRTLLLSDKTGLILSYKQTGASYNNTQWPLGYSWSSVTSNEQTTATNSSFAFTKQDNTENWVIFPRASGGIGAQQIDPTAEYDDQFGDYSDNLDWLPTMQGTAFGSTQISTNFTLIVYQESGSNISYTVLDSTNTYSVTNGTIYYLDGGWWNT